MRRPQRSPRLATLCVRGKPATDPAMTAARLTLLRHAIQQLGDYLNRSPRADWGPLDAIVLPAGYFRIGVRVGPLSTARRYKVLARQRFLTAISELCAELAAEHPKMLVIVGIDSDAGDQLCVAISAAGIISITRKVFPNEARPTRRGFIASADDFSEGERYVVLPSGHKAVLCACYDVFGLAEDPDEPSGRTRAIRRLYVRGKIIDSRDPAFKRLRAECVAAFRKRFYAEKPDLALAVIHGFVRPGLDGYWQRHGLATASSLLWGRLALGSAHFHKTLPRLDQSPLAAFGTPDTHLVEGLHRTAWPRYPTDNCEVIVGGKLVAILRLYTGAGA